MVLFVGYALPSPRLSGNKIGSSAIEAVPEFLLQRRKGRSPVRLRSQQIGVIAVFSCKNRVRAAVFTESGCTLGAAKGS